MLNVCLAYSIPFVSKHRISVLASEKVRPNATHNNAVTILTFPCYSGDCEMLSPSSAYSMSRGDVARAGLPAGALPRL